MSNLPSGTVTFLFTDIEGSTKLARDFPAALPAALARHQVILREAIEGRHGHIFQIVGDAFCAAFHQAADGLNAALAAQRALRVEAWGSAAIKVRMGLHAGGAEVRDGAYYGYLTLSRAQRLMSAASGGQVLVSSQSEALVRERLPAGVALRDLGRVHLKDFPRAEHVFQLHAPGLLADFPPLKSLSTTPNNLPLQMTSFVGREHEIVEVKRLLTTTRLLTLTGSGGVGKTRLSLQVAGDALDTFPDGVWFIELAPLTDPALVPQTVAAALGVREETTRPIIATLVDHMRDKHLLLVLDNCEHLIEACAKFTDTVLHAGRATRILASSREALGIAGELAYRVPSLQVPNPAQTRHIQIEQVMGYEAVRLFSERATFAQPTFMVTNANAPAVAQVCHRLDGIPLAIELAAARVKGLSAEQIADRLNNRFRLLTSGNRSALPRHQTLYAAIDWSHELLPEPERVLLRRLSVFAGGWSLEAAEEVASGNPAIELRQRPEAWSRKAGEQGASDFSSDASHLPLATSDLPRTDVLDLLLRLVDKSLVVMDALGHEARYHMLESIRQYALAKLEESGEKERVRDRHLHYYVELAETAEPELRRAEQVSWFDRLDSEHDNLLAAIDWSLATAQMMDGLRLTGALHWFWYLRGYTREALERLAAMLAQPTAAEHGLERTKVLNSLGHLSLEQRDLDTARAGLTEALAEGRSRQDFRSAAVSLQYLGRIAAEQRDFVQAQTLIEESVTMQQRLDDKAGMVISLSNLADLALQRGEYPRAMALFSDNLERVRPLQDKTVMGYTLRRMGQVAIYLGEYKRAKALLREAMNLHLTIRNNRGVIACIALLAAIQVALGQARAAAALAGAVTNLQTNSGVRLLNIDQVEFELNVAKLRTQLDETGFEKAWAEGRALTMEQAIALALEESD